MKKTVVITGASSGIGRATALAFARQGANVVLASRRRPVLEEVAFECFDLGATPHVVVADMTRPADVQQLAREALEAFGQIDVWVNNAGSGAMGRFEETPLEAHEAVIRLNLLGYFYGAYAVLPHFKQRGRGVLINMNSVGAWVPAPYAAAYSASKFGLRGFAEALRAELSDWPDIHVCDIFPGFVDTPAFRRGANYTGREIRPAPPTYSPEKVAATVVDVAEHPREEAPVGASAAFGRWAHAVLPGATRQAVYRWMNAYFENAPHAPLSANELLQAHALEGEVSGDYRAPLPLARIGTAVALMAVAWWGVRPALRARLAK
jgi:short-subunit dehydrogenase